MKRKYTEDNVREVVSKCETLKDFRTNYRGYYDFVNKNKLWHLTKPLKRHGSKYLIKFLYSIEFENKSVYVGITENPILRLSQHGRKGGRLIKELKEMKHRFIYNLIPDNSQDAVYKESLLMENYKKQGWNVLNKISGGDLGRFSKEKF